MNHQITQDVYHALRQKVGKARPYWSQEEIDNFLTKTILYSKTDDDVHSVIQDIINDMKKEKP